MKRERLHLSRYTSIETYRDWNGRVFIACSGNVSMMFSDPVSLRKWLKLPKGIPMRESFDSWIASLEAADAAKRKPLAEEGLSDELLATGFGPEAHLDESDPNYQTRMVT
jgi:hypothetical protein